MTYMKEKRVPSTSPYVFCVICVCRLFEFTGMCSNTVEVLAASQDLHLSQHVF